jgi:hypothetical protein
MTYQNEHLEIKLKWKKTVKFEYFVTGFLISKLHHPYMGIDIYVSSRISFLARNYVHLVERSIRLPLY